MTLSQNTKLQTRFLRMIGLGEEFEPADPNDEYDLEGPGIHLKWNFATVLPGNLDVKLGWPSEGFELWKRKHIPPKNEADCVKQNGYPPPSAHVNGLLFIPGIEAYFQFSLPLLERIFQQFPTTQNNLNDLLYHYWQEHPGEGVTVRFRQPVRWVALDLVDEGYFTLELESDSITHIVIFGEPGPNNIEAFAYDNSTSVDHEKLQNLPGLTIVQICRTWARPSLDGWEQVIKLPVRTDWAQVSSRISSTFQSKYEEIWKKAIVKELLYLFDPNIAGERWERTDTGEGQPESHTPDPNEPLPVLEYNVQQMLQGYSADPYVARLLGLYYVDGTVVDNDEYDFLIEGVFTTVNENQQTIEVSLGWACYKLSLKFHPELKAPEITRLRQLEPGVIIESTTGNIFNASYIGIKWYMDLDEQNRSLPYSANRFLIYYRQSGANNYQLLTTNGPEFAAAREDDFGVRVLRQDYYEDGPRRPGVYYYQIQGVDVFYRRSEASREKNITVTDTSGPHHPVNIWAKYLDRMDLPLESEESRLGNDGLLVRFDYPRPMYEASIDCATFEVYVHKGLRGNLVGKIGSVTVEPDRSHIILQIGENIATPHIYDGGTLSIEGNPYKVVSHGTGPNSAVRIVLSPRQASSDLVTIIASASGKKFLLQRDWTTSGTWGPFSAQVPHQKKVMSNITSVVETTIEGSEYKSFRITTDSNYTAASGTDPKGNIWIKRNGFLWVANVEQEYPIIDLTEGPNSAFIVAYSASTDSGTNIPAPVGGGQCIIYPGYQVFLPNYPLPFEPGKFTATAIVAAGATDSGNNKGPISPYAGIQRVSLDKPSAPGAFDIPGLMASKPNFYGKSSFQLKWNHSATDNAGYLIYRAVDEAVLKLNGMTAADGRSMSNSDLKTLAERESSVPAFIFLNSKSKPLNTNTYLDDTLEGASKNRYFYRIRTISPTGVFGPLGESTPPVSTPDVTPPRQPQLNKAVGGQNRITITFAPNREWDVSSYKVYRTANYSSAIDIRLMGHVGNVQKDENASEMQFIDDGTLTDSTLKPHTNYYYRVTCVDQAGNESPASSVLVGRCYHSTPPRPPQLSANVVPPNRVELSWSGGDKELLIMLLWRSLPNGIWLPLTTGWTPDTVIGTSYSHTFDGLETGTTYSFKLKVMDEYNHTSESNDVEV
jgi:hypothetical protein